MTKRTFGMLAGMIGSAVGAWWWTRQRALAAARGRQLTPAREQGTVIFHNTPTAPPGI